MKKGGDEPLQYRTNQPIEGAFRATGVDSAAARSRGKLWALRSCITSKPRPALLRTSAQVLRTLPCPSWMDWLKLNPLRLKCHGADAEGGKPDPDDRPGCQEEVK